jgi:excisionase family DNA binding protein
LSQHLYSVGQVAERLGLHVRTVRNYVRDGQLKAARIGRQYRIAHADLEAFTGQPAPRTALEGARRRVEVTSIVQMDAIGRDAADRLTTLLMASVAGPRDGNDRIRIQTGYDEESASMKVVILGGAAATAELLRLVGVLSDEEAANRG